MSDTISFGDLKATRLQGRRCSSTVKARSNVLGREIMLCSEDAKRTRQTAGGATVLAGLNQGVAMKKRTCKYGRVKSGARKGKCRLHRVRRSHR